jgi:hypothetical protein
VKMGSRGDVCISTLPGGFLGPYFVVRT